MPKDDFMEQDTILGRSSEDLESYGSKGCGFLGKVVMSSGERPVLGRKVLVDLARPHLILICGKRGGGKCLDGETLVTLEDGSLVKIKELEHDSRKVLSLSHDYKIKTAQKAEFFKRPVERMLELTLRSGKKIKLTPEHPLLTIDGWKPAQELAAGSRIATPRTQPVFGNEFLKECEIKLLAYLLAEGHIKKRVVWFSNDDEKIVADFKQAVKNFNPAMEVRTSAKNNHRVINPDSGNTVVKAVRNNGKFAKGTIIAPKNFMREWLKEIGVYGLLSAEKFIPQKVLRLPKPKIALFLNRLFSCDGSIYFESNRYRLSYSSTSEKLARQVQHLLSRFEIISRIREKKSRLDGKEFSSFEIVIEGKNVENFLKEIGFYGMKEERQKKALLEAQAIRRNPNNDTIPIEIWNHYRPKSWVEIGKQMNYSIPKSLCESVHYAPSRQKLLQIARLDGSKLIEQVANSDIFWDEIKNVKELSGSFEVYDISVPEEHNFVANDIIVHNSYTLSVMLEEFSKLAPAVKARVAVIAIDTVGIFWTMKVANKQEKQELFDWGLEPQGIDTRVLVPQGRISFYKDKQIPVDGSFTLRVSDLDYQEWLSLFKISWKEPEGVLLTRVIEGLKETKGTYYGLEEIKNAIDSDQDSDKNSRDALKNRFEAAESWGLFEKEGSRIMDLAKPGAITIIDVSSYRQSIGMEGTRDIIVGLIGKKLFEERMLYRKEEEIKLMKGLKRESELPIIWMLIDEAHMFMPKTGENIALNVLLEWIRVGRQPGLSLVLATQMPNKMHSDAISQCDLFIAHRMTAQADIQAVSELRPSYMHQDFDKYFEEMPKSKGYAIVLDDNAEKLWLVKIRPRYSWDGGTTATAFTD